jgi:ABC-type nickel/cobalt efflux system permease component RcnA
MIPSDAFGLFAGAVALGAAHGIEPGHGWPVAASYALDQTNKWLYGLAASFLLGLGHLVSSIAMVVAFFFAKRYFSLTQINEPLEVLGVRIGGPVGIVAGLTLVALGIREYFHGHSHDHGGGEHERSHDHSHSGHDHSHDDHGHSHGHGDDHPHGHGDEHSHDGGHSHSHAEDRGRLGKVTHALPFVGGHSHGSAEDAADRGLWGIAGFAFVLGFAHEEEFEIIAMCAGSDYCLSLMTTYAVTVIAGIVALTLLLIAGYERYEERVERYTDYLPLFSAVVLIVMGLGFISGLF